MNHRRHQFIALFLFCLYFYSTPLTLASTAVNFDPLELVGCFRTLEVNSRPVDFRLNKAMSIENESFMSLTMKKDPIHVIQMAVFKKRHADWDEWAVFEIFKNLGRWKKVSTAKFRYDFKGKLRLRSMPSATLRYQSFLEVSLLSENQYQLFLGYKYTSSIGMRDQWQARFRVLKLGDEECD